MDTASVLVHSKFTPFGTTHPINTKLSFRHFNNHLVGSCSTKKFQSQGSLKPIELPFKCTLSSVSTINTQNPYPHSLSLSPSRIKTHLFQPIKCSYSDTIRSESQSPLVKNLKNLSFDLLKETLLRLTPVGVLKWSLAISVAIAATKWTANVLLSPFFWMYFSWTWLFWPWIVAIGLGSYGLYCFRKHLRGEANVFEQLAIVTSAFTWLTLVPPAHFNGFLEGWPYVFFIVYHYFFFFNVSVRKRLYGDYYPREHDPKWDVSLPNWCSVLFSAGVMAGHWLAAFEGPELHLIPGGWNSFGIWILIMTTLFMQYDSTTYLAKYSEKVVVPTAVVQFGPYRWVRHPIYASTMFLFVTYFMALRAPLTSLFTVAVCLMYYGQKAKLEEALMVETFGESYIEYMKKVRPIFFGRML